MAKRDGNKLLQTFEFVSRSDSSIRQVGWHKAKLQKENKFSDYSFQSTEYNLQTRRKRVCNTLKA